LSDVSDGKSGVSGRPLKHGASRPTIIDVARLAGVSTATVSNTLNNRLIVDKVTRGRVQAAVQELGYTPNLRARRLRTGRADTIGIFSSMAFTIAGGRARLGFMMEIAATAASRALDKGIALTLIPPHNNGRSPFQDLHIDGALVVEPLEGEPAIALLRSRGVPVVSIGRQLGKAGVPFVDLRSYESAQTLIHHLYEQSSARIGLVVGAQPRSAHRETEKAYRDFMRSRGAKAIVRQVDEAGGSDASYEATTAMLSQHPEIDALLVSVDAFAVGARRAAADMGMDVPNQLKIATRYDGNLARECNPPLTALNLHLDEIAALAVDLLFEQISSSRNARTSIAGPAATLVPRRSSAATARS
jgi:DNA-binding LacI/PurR family transcriptional regulator